MSKQQFTAQDLNKCNNYHKALADALVEAVKKMVVLQPLRNDGSAPFKVDRKVALDSIVKQAKLSIKQGM